MKKCLFCHTDFEPKNPKGKFCSDKCRVYWNRKNKTKKKEEKQKVLEELKESIAAKIKEIKSRKCPEWMSPAAFKSQQQKEIQELTQQP